MRHPNTRRQLAVTIAAALIGHAISAAESTSTSRPSTGPSTATARPAPTPPRSSNSKAVLPDPSLLDGSTQAPEKKSEHGMIGDFELPGDENVRSGKVGGPQNPNGAPPAGGGAAANMPMGMPAGGGAQGGQQAQQMPQGGAQGGAQSAQNGQQQGGGAQGPQNPSAGGNPVAGAGDPGGQPQGIQVAELGGQASGEAQGGGASDPSQKPGAVAIGDPAMRIETSAAAQQAGVVGANKEVATHTQQHEKGTGSGGKGAAGSAGGNRVEKGRVIPSGL